MSSLVLHVGLGKTGTSSIQQAIYPLFSKLAPHILNYPYDNLSFASGNGHLIMSAVTRSDLSFLSSHSKSFCTVFSREHMARELSDPYKFFSFRDYLYQFYQPTDIRVIVYIREPSSHCFSLWSQKVKNHKTLLNLSAFSKQYDSYTILLSFLLLAVQSNWSVKVVDYDDSKTDLLSSFLDFLPIPLIYPSTPRPHINKSPSYHSLLSIRFSALLSRFLRRTISPNNFLVSLFCLAFALRTPLSCAKYLTHQYKIYNFVKSNFLAFS